MIIIMKKPIVIFRKQKSVAIILMSAVILFIGILIILEKKSGDGDVAVFAGQNEGSAPNETIEDLLTRVMND